MERSANRASLWAKVAFTAALTAVVVVCGFSQVAWADLTAGTLQAQSVQHLPDVTDEMTQASYWIAKQKDPTAVLADRATIDALNKAGVDADNTYLQPLKDAAERFYTQDEQKTLQKGAISDLASFVRDGAEDVDGNPLTFAEADAIANNIPTDGSTPTLANGSALPSGYAIVTTHTTMRNLPTDRMMGLTPGDADDDNLYLSMLRVNEPLLIRAQSVDKKFYLCISSCMQASWVPAEDIAICHNRDEWLKAWDIPVGQELVVTGYKVRTEQSRETPNTANRLLYMGTVLQRVDLESPLDALVKVGTRSAFDRHVCYLPVRNADGTYSEELALIAQSADVSAGYLPLTTQGVGEQAFKSLGQMYGWGGMLEANDCSGYVRDVYKCFGLELARNTSWQMNLPVRKYNLEGMSDEHKAAAIAQMPLGTVLFWGGHEMIYLGQENGKLYVISSLGGIGDVYNNTDASYQVKGVAVNTLDTIRANHDSWLKTLTCANIPYIPNGNLGPALDDIAFYEGGFSWPEESYVYTGQAIRPNVELAGLSKGTDYTVAFESNVEVGTATVTVNGAGSYHGEISRTFEILSPSLDNAKVTAADQCFTGTALEPAPTVTLGDVALKPGDDYTVAYSNNTNPGTATVTVTGAGKYTGSASGTFKIGRGSLEDATVTVEDQLYTGKELTPEVSVVLDGTTLGAQTDYSVSYENNVKVGTATVVVTGKGDYIGATSATFQIAQAPIAHATTHVQDQVYAGKALVPEPIVTIGSTVLSKDVDYVVSYANNVNVGTATVRVEGIGAYKGETSKAFKIHPAPISGATVALANKTYTGKAQTPKPTVTAGSAVLNEGSDYVLSYVDNRMVGTALVKVAGMGNFAGVAFGTFEIGKAPQTIAAKNATKKYKAARNTKKLAKNRTINLKKVAKVSAKTTVRYKKINKAGGKKIVVNARTGKVILKKGLARGTYKVKVKLTAAASVSYKAAKAKTVTLKVKVV